MNFQAKKDGGEEVQRLNSNNVLDLSNEINLDDLTQEDKFYLFQQIEHMQQNIRYGGDGSPYIFQDFEEADTQLEIIAD